MMSTPARTPASPALSAKAQYDAVAPNAKKRRREARVELNPETGKGSAQLPPMTRLAMIALVRDAARNFSSARAMLKQLGLNVVGTEYKMRIKLQHDAKDPKDPVVKGVNWFNHVFARNCDFRGDLHLFDMNRLFVQSVAMTGDVGMLFDRDFKKTGRLIAFESDQICDPTPLPAGVASSNDGVLLDSLGREIGYFAHPGMGKASQNLTEGHVFPRDPLNESANMFRLLRAPWRFNQYRGTSDMFSVVADLLDVYEMRAKELQAAKVAATLAGVIKKKDPPPGGPSATDPRLNPGYVGTADVPAAAAAPEPSYDRLEALTGGAFQYLAKDDVFEMLDPKRPNINTVLFGDSIIKSAGSSFGMARCYSTMEAQASYTAFRGEMVMTWVMFAYWQKWLERYVQDWQGTRALQFAQDTGIIPALPVGWQFAMAWQHPRMPSINPLIDQQTFLAALRNGTTNLEEELGPGWRDIIEQLQAEIEYYAAAKIPHPLFQTVAGAPIPAPDGNASDTNATV